MAKARVKRSANYFKHANGITIGKGNKKLSDSIGIFNLPAIKTCPNCSSCAKTCYAYRDETGRYAHVIGPCREKNLQASKLDSFVEDMVETIIKSKVKVFRIHESGDFYSQEYADKWSQIAEKLPAVQFYCYTKSPYRPNAANINIVESILPDGSLNYGELEDMMEKACQFDAFICPCKPKDRSKLCGTKCTKCQTHRHVVFILH